MEKYINKGSLGEFTVHASKKGYVVEFTSSQIGSVTGSKFLVEYCSGFPRFLNLSAVINDHGTTNGDRIANYAPAIGRCLRNGIEVR